MVEAQGNPPKSKYLVLQVRRGVYRNNGAREPLAWTKSKNSLEQHHGSEHKGPGNIDLLIGVFQSLRDINQMEFVQVREWKAYVLRGL